MTPGVFELDDGREMRYGLSVPTDYDASADEAHPLILALHPGGRAPYYGSSFMQSIVEPALRGWEAVIVAPDVPSRSWSDRESESAVLALVDQVMKTHSIDPTQILITGFSMGGGGGVVSGDSALGLVHGGHPHGVRSWGQPNRGAR